MPRLRLLLLAWLVVVPAPATFAQAPEIPDAALDQLEAAQHNRQADVALTAGRPDLALQEISEAVRLDPSNLLYRKKRGGLCLSLKRYAVAHEDFTEVICRQPGEAEVYYYRGCCHEHPAPQAVSDQAIADFTEAIRLKPTLVEAYRRRGDEYQLVYRDYARAMTDYDMALRLEPTYRLYLVRGMAHQNLKGDHDRAIADFTAGLRLAPNLPLISCLRGLSYRKIGKLTEALADLNRAIALDPSYGFAFQQRSETYTALGDTKRAADDRLKAQSLPVGPSEAASRRGMPAGTQAP